MLDFSQTSASSILLVFHGGVVVLVGMLTGFPYGAAIVKGADAFTVLGQLAGISVFLLGAWRAMS